MDFNDEPLTALKTFLGDESGCSDLSMEDVQSHLEQFQRRETLGRIAAGAAHEFNRSLTIIMGFEELALHSMPPDHPLCEHLLEIAKAANQATWLTRQIQNFSRRESHETAILDIDPLVEDVHRMVSSCVGDDIELVCVHASGLGRVRASAGQLEQVLINLVLNARDAMPHGGRLTLVTENVFLKENLIHAHGVIPSGSYVRLAISDTGCGMDEAALARVFQPCFASKEPGGGTGFGLALMQRMVQRNGGQIVVASEPGRGSTFAVYLPRVTAAVGAPHREMPGGRSAQGC